MGEPDLIRLAAAMVEECAELRDETQLKIKKMQTAIERSRDLRRTLAAHLSEFLRARQPQAE